MCKKFHYDRLRKNRALGNRKSDNNKNSNNKHKNNNKNNVRGDLGPVSGSKKSDTYIHVTLRNKLALKPMVTATYYTD